MPSSNNSSGSRPDDVRPGVSHPSRGRARRIAVLAAFGWLGLALPSASAASKTPKPEVHFQTFTGCCDASAGAPLNDDLIATASDEDNVLRLYRPATGGAPVVAVNVSTFIGSGRAEEADLEAAARVGSRIFWIGSHSRGADGRPRPARHVLFATTIKGEGEAARLHVEQMPYRGLVRALASEPSLSGFRFLDAAAIPSEKPGGLNIEGLAEGPAGSLLIGFRNPVPGRQALVVPLTNPTDVIAGRPPQFGAALRLNLGGLGIRDLARSGTNLYVIAGPAEGGGRHRLFRLPDGADRTPEEWQGAIPRNFQAEAIIAPGTPRNPRLLLLGDEGDEKIGGGGQQCQELKDPARRAFRGSWTGAEGW